ncbi:MAG: hypothetical protein ACK555_11325 [Acidobacteriota bacterium]|jgi:hypothetical protein
MDRRLPERELSAPRIIENSHLIEEALEAYSLGRLSREEDISLLEEHLLLCPWCQTRLEQFDAFTAATKLAAQAVLDQPSSGQPRGYMPVAIAAGAVGLLLIPAALERYSNPADLELVAVRNENRTQAPAGRKLHLKTDLTGLPAGTVSWELVSASGEKLEEGALRDGHIELEGLPSGQFWIRLKQGESVVREFSLSVR